LIEEYKNKKLAEYIKPNGKYLIRFGHGLGDTIMFLPAFDKLRAEYADCTFHLHLECGQELEWGSYRDDGTYDEIFHLDFPMCEGESGITKMMKCCRDELGIKSPTIDTAKLEQKENPFVAVHFQGTALPGSVNCPEEIAKQIWNEIISAGKIPIEIHFEHIFHNPVNNRYPFITRSMRDLRPRISTLIAAIQHCFAFVGVASGPFVAALSCLPGRVMYIQKYHMVESYTRSAIPVVDVLNFKSGEVHKWLNSL